MTKKLKLFADFRVVHMHVLYTGRTLSHYAGIVISVSVRTHRKNNTLFELGRTTRFFGASANRFLWRWRRIFYVHSGCCAQTVDACEKASSNFSVLRKLALQKMQDCKKLFADSDYSYKRIFCRIDSHVKNEPNMLIRVPLMNMIYITNCCHSAQLQIKTQKTEPVFTHCEKRWSRNCSNRKTCCIAAFHFAKTPTRSIDLHVKTEGGTRWNFVNFL